MKAVLRVRIFAKQSKQKVIIMAASRVTHTDKFNICGREAKKAATTVLDCSVIHGVTSHAKRHSLRQPSTFPSVDRTPPLIEN